MTILIANNALPGATPVIQGPGTVDYGDQTIGRYSYIWRTAELAGAYFGARALHRYALRRFPGYGPGLYQLAHLLEERSPAGIFSTFGLSERFSSYVIGDIHIPRSKLLQRGGLPEEIAHMDRLLGGRLREHILGMGPEDAIDLVRPTTGSPYHKLVGVPNVDAEVRLVKKGRLSGSSSRVGKPLSPRRMETAAPGDSPFQHAWNQFNEIKRSQHPTGYKQGFQFEGALAEEVGVVQPYLAKISGQPVRNLLRTTNTVLFEQLERMQRLGAEVGIGLRAGSYNQIAHIPFFGGTKNRGIINEMLLKRVLPAAIALSALKYGDYLLHHVPSETALGAVAKARVLHAQFTQAVPGLAGVTEGYGEVVPGPQYGPLALPLLGGTAGALIHYGRVIKGDFPGGLADLARKRSARVFAAHGDETLLKIFNRKSPVAWGVAIGLAAMLPFIPGMLGSRKTPGEVKKELSGEEPVPIRSGRWWDMGTTPFAGGRIKEYRPHWYALWKAHAAEKSLYGSEEEAYAHDPLLHPIRYLRDPYYLERQHYHDRPYPITSPAFSNVPLIGPLLAATIGRIVKPPVRMHDEDWDEDHYRLYSSRLEPRQGKGLPPATPRQEFSLKDVVTREARIFTEYVGLPGFIAHSLYQQAYPNQDFGRDVLLQGSRQMDSTQKAYYEKELGAGLGPHPQSGKSPYGFSEPLRRFIQRETGLVQANDIPNTMPSWLPGEDYFVDFRTGDPFAKLTNSYARLPGPGYAALHPELEGVDPENYPDYHRFQILADIAPYSKEFATYRGRIAMRLQGDTALAIEYEKTLDRVKRIKESVIQTDQRRFTAPVDEITGTVTEASPSGITLKEYPGRTFQFSSVGSGAADLSAAALGDKNDLSREEMVSEVQRRQVEVRRYLSDRLSGAQVKLTVPRGAVEHAEQIRAVVESDGDIINQELIHRGLGIFRKDLGGAETRAMFGGLGQTIGGYAETMAFVGDESLLNPLRFVPSPGHTKLWQEHTALSEYIDEEVLGTRMRRWQKPIHDFLAPYLRGVVQRTTGKVLIPQEVVARRDTDTLVDMLDYLRSIQEQGNRSGEKGRYTSQASRTAVGANQFGSPTFLSSTLPSREAHYFTHFLSETDPDKRREILEVVPQETARALTTQWVATDARLARAEGRDVPELGDEGRLFTQQGLDEYKQAKTQLGYGDYLRSREIAEFFTRTGYRLPGPEASVWDDAVDYEDVKLKIVQQEGYDAHDFNLFDDRAALLWRKPWLDGAVRELTSGGNGSLETIRQSVEDMILAAHDGKKNPSARVLGQASPVAQSNLRIDVEVDEREKQERDLRHNPEEYEAL